MGLDITNETASAGILAAATEGRLVQGKWHRQNDGRELACLLGSIHPKVKSAKDCTGKLMPLWMAEVTIRLFDRLPAAEIVPIAQRYGLLIARWGAVTSDQWDNIMRAFLVRCIDDALDAARPVSEGKSNWAAFEKSCAEYRRVIVEKDNAAADAADAANAAANAATPHKLFTFLLYQIEAAIPTRTTP